MRVNPPTKGQYWLKVSMPWYHIKLSINELWYAHSTYSTLHRQLWLYCGMKGHWGQHHWCLRWITDVIYSGLHNWIVGRGFVRIVLIDIKWGIYVKIRYMISISQPNMKWYCMQDIKMTMAKSNSGFQLKMDIPYDLIPLGKMQTQHDKAKH